MMGWRSGYFDSESLSGGDYMFIVFIIIGLVLVGRYVYGQYHKENKKLPPLAGQNIKRRVTVEDLYPKKKDD